MRSKQRGVVSYPKARGARLAQGLALVAGVASLGSAAQAATASVDDATDVSGVTVTGGRSALDTGTGLSVLPTTVQDTPQAISVIDAAQLKAQGVNSLEQALRNVPGITIAIGEGGTVNGDQFKIRGFDAKDDIYIDGLRDFGNYTRDSFNYQEVQVLKGPSGAMFGRGTTGGVINTVSKRPLLRDMTAVDAYVGNGDYYRGLVDFNKQLSDTSAVRVNLMYSDTGVVDRDYINSKRWGAAATVGFGLGADTSFTLTAFHQHDNRRPDYGIIIVQRPGDIVAKPATEYDVGVERSSYLGFLADVDRTTADVLTAHFTHKFDDKVTFTSDTRYGVYSRYFQYSTTDSCNAACVTGLFDGNPATEANAGIGGTGPYDSDSWGLQNISTIRVDYDLGSLKNQLIVGTDLSKSVNDKNYFAYTLPAGVTTRPNMPHPLVNPNPNFPAGYTLFRPVPGQNIFCPATGTANCTTTAAGGIFTNASSTGVLETHGESDSVSAFITDRVWLTDALSVIGSMRLERYTAKLDTLLMTGAAAPVGGLRVKSTLKSPRVSVVFEPDDRNTIYASWGRSETPQGTSITSSGSSGAVAISAKDLEPEVSKILEAGAKLAIPSTNLSFTVSVFDVKKSNSLQVDSATGFLLAQSGERQEVKGLELGVTGKVTPAWTITAGYAYLDAKIKDSYSNCAVPTSTAGTPTGVVCAVGLTTAIPVKNTVAIGQQVVFVPKNSASFYTNYDFSDWIDGLSAGGDVTYQSKLAGQYAARSVSFTDRTTLTALRLPEIPSNLTFNAFASYHFGNYRVGLNVYNITNRLNYTQVFGNRAVPAAGRTFIVSLGATF